MSDAFSLPQSTIALLDQHGIRLAGLVHTKRLARGSSLEGPTSVLSTVAAGSFLDVGAFCNLSGGNLCNLRAGRYCSIAPGVHIGAHEHPTDWLTTSRTAYYPEVNGWNRLMLGAGADALKGRTRPFAASCPVTTLGPDVWIGQGAFLKAGITVGAGAIIGARATVLKDVPPYSIVVGTPGRVVRLRFPEAVVARLLACEWWRYSIYDLFDAPFDRVEEALDVIEARIADASVTPFTGLRFTAQDLATPETLASRLREGLPVTPRSQAAS